MATSADSRARPPARALASRLSEFVLERFLPLPTVIMISALVWCCIAAGASLAATTAAPATLLAPIPAALVTGAVTLLLLFRLRVFDDVKDAEHDRVHERDRPIPRGLVTERELNGLALAIAAIECVLASLLGWAAWTAWVIALTWTLLMRVEFFCGDWLESRPTLYAISHTLSGVPIAILACAGGMVVVGSPAPSLTHVITSGDGALIPLCIAMFVLSLGFEVGRKFPRYHAEIGAGAWITWCALPAVAASLLAISAAQLGAAKVGVALIGATGVLAVGTAMIAQRRIAVNPRAHSDTIELVPGVLGLTTLVISALMLTLTGLS